MTLTSVAVFCGSRAGHDPVFGEAARTLGASLARAGMELVYGGGSAGLMGEVADAALGAGGTVFGVIPGFLHTREVMHAGVTDLVVTGSMHERKTLMFARAQAFVILPGGLGTFDEFFEILTWKQLSLHDRPIVLVNVAGWADLLTRTVAVAVEQGFAAPSALALFDVVETVEAAMTYLREYSGTPTQGEIGRF